MVNLTKEESRRFKLIKEKMEAFRQSRVLWTRGVAGKGFVDLWDSHEWVIVDVSTNRFLNNSGIDVTDPENSNPDVLQKIRERFEVQGCQPKHYKIILLHSARRILKRIEKMKEKA